ncbi:hypothetical protein NE237_027402 [Protea cynaroides]|uniref:Uncharacterized protein n=1 Tax=Protea cynaroides TaxID=273540 RepID=A0A9Q0JU64_9MAGN|nr:hypothetical protein NE237_027402 [Protea cynaroides]
MECSGEASVDCCGDFGQVDVRMAVVCSGDGNGGSGMIQVLLGLLGFMEVLQVLMVVATAHNIESCLLSNKFGKKYLIKYHEEQQLQAQQQQASFYKSFSRENNKGKMDTGFNWDGDHRRRMGNLFPLIGLQRQSSGSSFEGSLFGDYYHPTLSMMANDFDIFSYSQDDGFKAAIGGG